MYVRLCWPGDALNTRFNEAIDLVEVFARHEAHVSEKVVRLGKVRPQRNRLLQVLAYLCSDAPVVYTVWTVLRQDSNDSDVNA